MRRAEDTHRWLALAAAVLAGGCNAGPPTALVVDVWSDLGIPIEIDGVRIGVTGAAETLDLPFALSATPAAGRRTLPLRLALTPRAAKDESFSVRVSGSLGATEKVAQEARVAFLPGQARILTMFLGRACQGVVCVDPATTCDRGQCNLPKDRQPEDLPKFDPGKPPSLPDGAAGGDAGVEPGGDAASDAPADAVADAPSDAVADVAADVAAEKAPDLATELPPPDLPIDLPKDSPLDPPADLPVDLPKDPPPDLPTDLPEDPSPDSPAGTPPSCVGLPATCGPSGDESCCQSLLVPGGSYDRSNDPMFPATVSDFRLDRFEITVGRFRKFVGSGMGTVTSAPADGSGANPNAAGTGWSAKYTARLADSTAMLKMKLKCDAMYQTWTDSPGGNENRPMNCITSHEAFAFCIWDGGRLASEAEWSYAAVGGSEQREYAWGLGIDATRASYWVDGVKMCYGDGMPGCDLTDILVVGSKPAGDGRWGHADLSGNVEEWTFDWYAPFVTPCTDCVALMGGMDDRMELGGGFGTGATDMLLSRRMNLDSVSRFGVLGSRCARDP